MKRLISCVLVVCILAAIIPIRGNATEVQRVRLSDSEKSILALADKGEIDNMTGGGTAAKIILWTVVIIIVAVLVAIIAFAAIHYSHAH